MYLTPAEQEFMNQHRAAHPTGLPLNFWNFDFQFVPEEVSRQVRQGVLKEPLMRQLIPDFDQKIAPIQDDLADREQTFEQCWTDLRWEKFASFSDDDLARLYAFSFISSAVSERFRHDPRYQLFWKVFLSMWHWGHEDDYNLMVNYHTQLRRFDFGLADFEARIDHTTGCNELGYSEYSRTFLDGELAYLIHYKGEHVLTIGFCVTRSGVIVSQIQMVKDKGNRWAYKVPGNYFDYCLQRMAACFQGRRLWLIAGTSAASQVFDSYPTGVAKPSEQVLARISNTYAQRLSSFRRSGARKFRRYQFFRLVSKAA